MDNDPKTNHLKTIKQQIDDALAEIEKLRNQTSTIKNVAELQKFEKGIVKKVDQLRRDDSKIR